MSLLKYRRWASSGMENKIIVQHKSHQVSQNHFKSSWFRSSSQGIVDEATSAKRFGNTPLKTSEVTSILKQKNFQTMNSWSDSESLGGFCGVQKDNLLIQVVSYYIYLFFVNNFKL